MNCLPNSFTNMFVVAILAHLLKLIHFLVNSSKYHFLALVNFIFKKYKTYTVTSTRVEIGKTRNCVETRRPLGGVFSHNFEFFQFSRVLI